MDLEVCMLLQTDVECGTTSVTYNMALRSMSIFVSIHTHTHIRMSEKCNKTIEVKYTKKEFDYSHSKKIIG